MEETMDNATPGAIFCDLPAKLYTSGTTEDTPNPTNKNPMVEGMSCGKHTADNKPVMITKPLVRKTSLTPNLVIIKSAMKRPVAMAAINEINPKRLNWVGASTTFSKYTPLQSNMVPSHIMQAKAMAPNITMALLGFVKMEVCFLSVDASCGNKNLRVTITNINAIPYIIQKCLKGES